ncbi:MAG: DUF3105 domain-containing protein [Candidatus Bipolaricaulota bacterium]|nr:DUF3105 domain-containing protein [Candidatus Bipolaricaulota bacterium]
MRQMARPRRRERLSEFQRRLRRWRMLGLVALGLLVLAGWGAYQLWWSKPGIAIPIQQPIYALRAGETVQYNSLPPTSGPYARAGVGWGIHDAPLPHEIQVHMLRRGGVLVQYRPVESPALPDPVAEGLKRLIGRLRTFEPDKYCKVILAPYALLDQKIALTAWGRLDTFDAEEITPQIEERIRYFLDRLIDAYNPERVTCP